MAVQGFFFRRGGFLTIKAMLAFFIFQAIEIITQKLIHFRAYQNFLVGKKF